MLKAAANRLPCQKKPENKRIHLDSTTEGNWLRGKLKLSEPVKATKAVADSCCGNKPYSSATNQCCFGRVIELEDVCCFNGKSLQPSEECSCVPPQKWVEVEMSRVFELGSSIQKMKSDIEAAISEKQKIVDQINDQISDLDRTAGTLEKKFYKLVDLDYGDPEAQLIEEQIINVGKGERRPSRRIRRYFPDEFIPDYARVEGDIPNYDSEGDTLDYHMEQDFVYQDEKILYDEIYTPEYIEEPDPEKAHIDQVTEIVQKRRNMREEISMLSSEKRVADSFVNRLHDFLLTLLSIQTPTDEIQSLVDSTMEKTVKSHDNQKCDVTAWNKDIIYYLDVISGVANQIEQLNDEHSDTEVLAKPIQRLRKEIHKIHFWHEHYDRKNAILTDANYEEELEEFENE